MLNKQEFLDTYKWELNTLLKVIKAIPSDNFDYRPHEKSKSAKELTNSLVAEVNMTTAFLRGESVTEDNAGSFFVNAQETLSDTSKALEEAIAQFTTTLTEMTEDRLDSMVRFFHRETTVADAIFNMMLDMIHHRGQLSVYIRLAGGLVPSIYGPSADEEFVG